MSRTDHGEARARIAVRVRAAARRDEVGGVVEDMVVVFVSAPAHDGRANRATLRLLAKRLGVPQSRLRILRGERARDKLVEVMGIEQRAADAALGLDGGSATAPMQ